MANLSYLGNRNYIDVSTISSALYSAFPELTLASAIADLQLRILKKIEFDCQIVLEERVNHNDTALTEKSEQLVTASSALFDWSFQGKFFRARFIESDEKIVTRRPEMVGDVSHHLSYSNGEVLLFNPVNSDTVYNLMLMGRMVVNQKFGLIPRVARYKLDRLYSKSAMSGFSMRAERYGGSQFYKLEGFGGGRKFCEIIVTAFAPSL